MNIYWYSYIALAVLFALLFGVDPKTRLGSFLCFVFAAIWPLTIAFLVTAASITLLNWHDEAQEAKTKK